MEMLNKGSTYLLKYGPCPGAPVPHWLFSLISNYNRHRRINFVYYQCRPVIPLVVRCTVVRRELKETYFKITFLVRRVENKHR